MLAALCNCTVTVTRSTAYVVDSRATAASITPDRQPTRKACMQVALAGSVSGTVTISGTVEGVSDTETLTFSAAGTKVTVKQFSAVSGVTASLTGSGTISVMAVGPGGQPQAGGYTIRAGLPASRNLRGFPRWPTPIPGSKRKEEATIRLQYEDTWEPRQGDLVVVDGTTEVYEVQGRPRSAGNFIPDHWVLNCEMRQDR